MDPYLRLKPNPPKPEDEICSCPAPRVWKLMYALGENPIHCVRCNLEIRPEELGLTSKLVDDVATWCSMRAGLEALWLDSREYEAWATDELVSLDSPVTIRGRAVVERLCHVNSCYFQVFENENDSMPGWVPAVACGGCAGSLELYVPGRMKYLACHRCRLLYWAPGS